MREMWTLGGGGGGGESKEFLLLLSVRFNTVLFCLLIYLFCLIDHTTSLALRELGESGEQLLESGKEKGYLHTLLY